MSQSNQPLTPTPVQSNPTPAASTTATAPAITGAAKGGGKVPKVQIQAAVQALISGLQSTYQPTDNFNIDGETLSRDQVIANLNAFITTVEATKAARQQWTTAVEEEHDALPVVMALRQNLRGILQARLGGKGASGLTAFGFNPAKSPKQSVTGKATAVVKTAATRKARHTLGKVQKQSIKGDVVGITVTSLVASPPVPAPSSANGAPGATPIAPSNH